MDVRPRNKPQMNRDGELIKKAGNGTSSLTKLLLVMVVESCRSPLFTSRQQTLSATLKMGGCSRAIHSQGKRKNWKNNKTPGSVLCSSQPASSSDLSPFFSSYIFFSFQRIHLFLFFFSFLFVLYQATAHNNRNCSGGRKIEYKVVIYSRVWEKLRKI